LRVLVLYCHPNPESYGAALHAAVVDSLKTAGHEVDDCDLYAEDFQPILTRAERVGYHDLETNTAPVQGYVDRVRNAEALVIVSPVWNFGFPAMLKGFFDRVFLPGVSFGMVNGQVRGTLHNIKVLASVLTYGGDWKRATLVGNPPKKIVTRVIRAVVHPLCRTHFLAHYDMNRSTDRTRAAFLTKVRARMGAL
jgi:NAD(P)H dehydrogenase (quinone)